MKILRTALKIIVGLLGLLILVVYFWPEKAYEPHQPSDFFLEQAKDFYVPDFPEGWTEHSFTTPDNVRLRWGQTGNADTAKAHLLFVPGFGGLQEMYAEQISLLQARGYHVIGFDARGQGGSERDRPKQPEKMTPKDFKVYSDDFANFVKDRGFDGSKPVYVMGTSFGSHLSFRALGDHDLPVDGIVALAPAFKTMAGGRDYDTVIRTLKLMRIMGKKNNYLPGLGPWQPYSEDLTESRTCASDNARLYRRDVIFVDKPELRMGGATLQWILELHESGQRIMHPDYLAAFETPITIVLADNEDAVDNDVALRACTNGMKDCKVVWLENAGHCVLVEGDVILNRIFDELDALYLRTQNADL